MCLPIVVLGIYFYVRLRKNMKEIKEVEKKEKEEQKKAKERAKHEELKRKNFYDDYDRSKGYR